MVAGWATTCFFNSISPYYTWDGGGAVDGERKENKQDERERAVTRMSLTDGCKQNLAAINNKQVHVRSVVV